MWPVHWGLNPVYRSTGEHILGGGNALWRSAAHAITSNFQWVGRTAGHHRTLAAGCGGHALMHPGLRGRDSRFFALYELLHVQITRDRSTLRELTREKVSDGSGIRFETRGGYIRRGTGSAFVARGARTGLHLRARRFLGEPVLARCRQADWQDRGGGPSAVEIMAMIGEDGLDTR